MSHENGGSRLVCSFSENADDSIPLDADDHAAENNQAISPRNPSIPIQSLESIYISLLMDDNHELSFLPENLDVKKYLEPEKILCVPREKLKVVDHLLKNLDCWLNFHMREQKFYSLPRR